MQVLRRSGRWWVMAVPLALVVGCSSPTAGVQSQAPSPTSEPANSPSAGQTGTSESQVDPAGWSPAELAAELVFAAAYMPDLKNADVWARAGVAGLFLLDKPGRNLKAQLAAIRAASPGSRLMIGSDEEGGEVQRLTSILGPLPSAAEVGRTKSVAQAKSIAEKYGRAMKALGVNVSFAPDSDVAVRGAFIALQCRSFSTDAATAAGYVTAWETGLRDAGVMGVLKHWPGHGSSKDTHIGSGTTPDWAVMQSRDLVPFAAGIADGACAVMVGHLIVPGLTQADVPASMSPVALAALRKQIGPNRLIMTDSLMMNAVTGAMSQTQTQAAVRSLAAGADVALVQTPDPLTVVHGIAAAIRSGVIGREQAVASARRVLSAASAWSMASPPGTRCS
ncbi:MAG: glycoside hydrolase family 3 N-terminal domain-containing protein [Actinomycetes bacterium]